MYERDDEAEPFEADLEAEPFEAADPFEASDEAEPFEAADPFESDGEADPEYYDRRRVQRGRPYGLAVRGVQTAVVKTPSGSANIQLPSRVPTLKEFRTTVTQVQKDLTRTNRRVRAARRGSARAALLSDYRAARNGIFILIGEQVRDVLKDYAGSELLMAASRGQLHQLIVQPPGNQTVPANVPQANQPPAQAREVAEANQEAIAAIRTAVAAERAAALAFQAAVQVNPGQPPANNVVNPPAPQPAPAPSQG
ncbi:MAG TPA: hypothetical protein VFI53_06910 [Myxococcaceae bacterium]|nr:hypothetical protein [Myxococcaceae bacterium]